MQNRFSHTSVYVGKFNPKRRNDLKQPRYCFTDKFKGHHKSPMINEEIL